MSKYIYYKHKQTVPLTLDEYKQVFVDLTNDDIKFYVDSNGAFPKNIKIKIIYAFKYKHDAIDFAIMAKLKYS